MCFFVRYSVFFVVNFIQFRDSFSSLNFVFIYRFNFYRMVVKILHWLGLLACIVLVISCFLPWTFHADIHQTFTGFYSYQNQYGKPGKFLTILSVVIFLFMLLEKIWAKRVNLFIAALTLGYAIKTYVLFSSCYNAYCPDIKTGLYVMLFSSCLILLATIFPDMKLVTKD